MPAVPKKVYERIVAGIKQFQPVLAAAESRGVNENRLKGSDPLNWWVNKF